MGGLIIYDLPLAFVKFPVGNGTGGGGFRTGSADDIGGCLGRKGGGLKTVGGVAVAVIEIDILGASGEGVKEDVKGGRSAAASDGVGQKFATVFGKANVAAVGLVAGCVGGVISRNGDVDVGFGSGMRADGDDFSVFPVTVPPGGSHGFGVLGDEEGDGEGNREKEKTKF